MDNVDIHCYVLIIGEVNINFIIADHIHETGMFQLCGPSSVGLKKNITEHNNVC